MGIFGEQQPKIVTDAGAEILLNQVRVLRDEPIYDNLMHTSDLTQVRSARVRPHNWRYEVSLNIFKQAVPFTIYETLAALRGAEVKLYRHREESAFRDSAGAEVPFVVKRVVPYYENTDYWLTRDAIILELESKSTISVTQTLADSLTDTFTDSDNTDISSHVMDSGQSWNHITDNGQALEVLSNKLHIVGAGTNDPHVIVYDSGKTDIQSATLYFDPASDSNFFWRLGFAIRVQDSTHYLFAVLQNSATNNVAIYKRAGGSVVTLVQGSATLAGGHLSHTWKIELTMIDDDITLTVTDTVDGSPVSVNVTSSLYAGETQHGIYAEHLSARDLYADDFSMVTV